MWTKQDLIDLFRTTLPDLDYHDLKRYLDKECSYDKNI